MKRYSAQFTLIVNRRSNSIKERGKLMLFFKEKESIMKREIRAAVKGVGYGV